MSSTFPASMGGRRTSAVGAAVLALALGCAWGAGTAVADTGGQAVAYQVDAAHDGYQPNPGLTLPLTGRWTVTLPATVSYPVVVGNVIYVTAGANLYAIDLGSGATLWQKSLGGTYGALGPAYDGGRLFVANTSGDVSALDPATGATLWSQALATYPPYQYSFSSSPTASGGYVYIDGAGVGGTVYALSEATGSLSWTSANVENGQDSSPAVSSSGVYVTFACDQDYDLSPTTGAIAWHYSTGCEGGGGATPALGNGDVFGTDGVLGNVILSAATGAYLGTFSSSTTPAIANGVLYTMSGTGVLQAVSDAGLGTVSWSFNGDGHLDSAPLVAGNVAYVGSSAGNLYAVNASTGAQLWSANVGAGIESPGPAGSSGLAVADQSLVVPAGDQLSVYRSPAATTTTLTARPTSAKAGQAVTLSATVAPSDGGGSVGFTVNKSSIAGCGTVALSGGVAHCVTSSLPIGSDTVTAAYTGDTAFAASTGSAGVTVTRGKPK